MDFNAKIETISSDQLDALFGEANATPGADNLIVGSQSEDDSFRVNTPNSNFDIPILDLDTIDNVAVTDEKKEEEGQEEVKTDETVTDEKKETPEVNAKAEEEGATEEESKEGSVEDEAQVKVVLKNTVDYLVNKGLWKDFDGREDLDIDADTYAELAAKQEEAKIDDMFSELVDSTGAYGKAIISHIKNGGNPDEIIDIFKEQKQVQKVDVTDDNSAVSLIEKYYSEEVGWSKAKIDRYINGLKADEDGIQEEAKELQTKYDAIYEEQIQQVTENEKKQQTERKRIQQEYMDTLSTTIDTFETFTDKEKRLVKDSVLKFNKKLDDGTAVNDFYLKFYEIQKNPKDYVELIHFVMDKKGYQEKFNKKAETKATDKAWNFVKGNGSVKKTGSQIAQRDNEKNSKIDFSGLFKNKK